jgi:hypothetical protein
MPPEESQGWTSVWRDRATRFWWERPWGRQDRPLWKHALRRLGEGSEPTGDGTLLTDGERWEGRLVCALCRQARRHGTRGRPKQTRPTGVTVRRKHTGAHRPRRGPKRPTYPAPSPEHPDTAQSVATHERQAHHLAACHTALRRRCAADRRRTHMEAQYPGRLQAR